MALIYLIRHGETEYNRLSKYCGSSDIPLNKKGKSQSAQLQRRFRNIKPGFVYSSDLMRTKETASIVFPKYKDKIITSAALSELDFGRWEGMTYEQITAKYKKAYEAWIDKPTLSKPPGGEGFLSLERRVKKFFATIITNLTTETETVAIVSSKAPLKIVLYTALGGSSKMFWRFNIDSAGVSVVECYEGKLFVHAINDTSHLKNI
ncbi:MAG: histidine phosphatase family protein [Planctomycetota bacterium]